MFHAKLILTLVLDFRWLPSTQRGFPNLNKRWRERQNPYTTIQQQQAIFDGRVQKKQPRHLFVRRRSNKMKKIPLPSWAVDAEKNLESGYQ